MRVRVTVFAHQCMRILLEEAEYADCAQSSAARRYYEKMACVYVASESRSSGPSLPFGDELETQLTSTNDSFAASGRQGYNARIETVVLTAISSMFLQARTTPRP